VEDEVTGQIDDIIVKKEVDHDENAHDETVEQVVVGGGKSTIQLEDFPQVAPNGDLTPEMILSMMDR